MKKRIDIVDTQLNRVVRIIQDLLSSTRQRNPEPLWSAPSQLVQPVVALMEPAFHAKHVTLKVEDSGPLPLAWADVEKIHQVLINLLTNALVATGGGGTVTVRLGSRPASTDESQAAQCTGRHGVDSMVLLSVHDTGCGMPPEDLQRAVEPFFTTKAHGKGTGLGLFLSRETILAHGGSLTIDSEVGKGTVVTVALPGWQADTGAMG
jgi:signal transduction histidine kinase